MNNKARVLIIDDDKDMQTFLNDALEDYKITSVFSGHEALKKIKKKDFDIVLLDVNLGDIDGYEICKQIRANESTPPIPVIFLSGKTSLDDILNGYDSGGTDYITKPFELAELTKKINVEVKTFRLERDLQANLNEVTDAVLNVQNSNAKIYAICRFLQKSFFCKDIEALCHLFFSVTEDFETEATIYVHGTEHENFYSSTGKEHAMTEAVLKQVCHDGGRIFQFGNGRAIFNWESASVLINKVADEADNIAMLMDGFEMGLKAITASNKFDKILTDYREVKYQQTVEVAKAFDDVVYEIQDEMAQIGYNTLSEEQETALIRIVESKSEMVDKLFSQGLKLEEQMSNIMSELRTDNTIEEEDDDDDGLDFF